MLNHLQRTLSSPQKQIIDILLSLASEIFQVICLQRLRSLLHKCQMLTLITERILLKALEIQKIAAIYLFQNPLTLVSLKQLNSPKTTSNLKLKPRKPTSKHMITLCKGVWDNQKNASSKPVGKLIRKFQDSLEV